MLTRHRILAAALSLCACLCLPASSQTPPTTTASQLANLQLPSYIAAGGAYNQFVGANLWGSAIIPIAPSIGLYESTTADIFPVKAIINGKAGYIFTTSLRQGFHKVIYQDPKNMGLFGADAGVVLPSGGTPGFSVSAAVTATYVRHLNASLALMIPARVVYIPSLGGWNPILEMGIVWKPGGGK